MQQQSRNAYLRYGAVAATALGLALGGVSAYAERGHPPAQAQQHGDDHGKGDDNGEDHGSSSKPQHSQNQPVQQAPGKPQHGDRDDGAPLGEELCHAHLTGENSLSHADPRA